MRLHRDDIERRDGSRGTYAYIEKRDFALVIPAERGGFHLVEEYRYPVGGRYWSFPQGGFGPGREGRCHRRIGRRPVARVAAAQPGPARRPARPPDSGSGDLTIVGVRLSPTAQEIFLSHSRGCGSRSGLVPHQPNRRLTDSTTGAVTRYSYGGAGSLSGNRDSRHSASRRSPMSASRAALLPGAFLSVKSSDLSLSGDHEDSEGVARIIDAVVVRGVRRDEQRPIGSRGTWRVGGRGIDRDRRGGRIRGDRSYRGSSRERRGGLGQRGNWRSR